MKRCSWCTRYLPTSEFWRNASQPDGRQSWCQACCRAWRLSYREIERVKDRQRWRIQRSLEHTSD